MKQRISEDVKRELVRLGIPSTFCVDRGPGFRSELLDVNKLGALTERSVAK